jgi:beta-barrel assembly-enhancing protease
LAATPGRIAHGVVVGVKYSKSISRVLSVAVLLAGSAFAEQAGQPNPQDRSVPQQQDVKVKSKIPAKYDVTQIGQRGIGKGMNFYSLDKEIALGRQLSQEIERQARLVNDPVITEYVNRVGQNIVRNSDAQVPFTIKVIDDEEVNAFALPGGFFYVNTGLILAADNEAELAGVMAHEIAHVAARHATKNESKAQLFNMASIPLIFVGGPIGYGIRQAAGLAVPMGFLKFSRNAEREADLLGLEYEYAAGYDPAAFVQFFEKLQAQDKKKHSGIAKAFSTHPMTEDRIKSAQESITKYLPEKPQYVLTTSEFDDVKTRLARLENRQRIDSGDPSRPTLRRRDGKKSDEPVIKTRDDKDRDRDSQQGTDDPDRPTLKRTNP